jgi:cell shape-determining protein MreC
MRLYLLAILILILSYFQVTKNLQLSFFNSFSPAILFFKELSIDLKEISLIIFNLDGIRQENTKLKKIIGELEGNKDKETLLNLNSIEISALESDFKNSQVLKNKNISIKKIIFYDSFQSKLILENTNQEKVAVNSLVLLGENLVGLVKNSNNSSIEVLLISSKDLLVNTHIINSQLFKIKTVLDSESGDSLIINNILTTEDVRVGDLVVTSNNNEGVVPDLIIGRIQRIEGISSQTFRKAYLLKNYDLGVKSYVGVLLND